MQQEQIKALLINILTVVVIIGVLIAGYIVFVKKDSTTVTGKVTTVASVAEQTSMVGMEIDDTMKDLRELSSAIERFKVFFDLPEFTNLENFSVTVPKENIGRDNPFVPTVWKINMKVLEDKSGAGVSAQASGQSASILDTQQNLMLGPLGDFDSVY